MQTNPVVWFEIYVQDMSRAVQFYEAVFHFKFETMPRLNTMGDHEMMMFPSAKGEEWATTPGCGGMLVKSAMQKPGINGTLIYFNSQDCSVEAERAKQHGGKIIMDKFAIGDYGYCAIFEDTEGNHIGIHSMQ